MLRPTDEALDRLGALRQALEAAHADNAVTVGIHVRTGDATFTAERSAGGRGGGGGDGAGGGGSSYTDPALCSNVIHTRGVQISHGKLTITLNSAE